MKIYLIIFAILFAGCYSEKNETDSFVENSAQQFKNDKDHSDFSSKSDEYIPSSEQPSEISLDNVSFGDYHVTVPSGWYAKEDVISDVPVLYLFKEGTNDSVYVTFSSLEVVGVGGTYIPDIDYGTTQYGDNLYSCYYGLPIYSGLPYSEEKSVVFVPSEYQSEGRFIRICYHNPDDNTPNNEDVQSILSSFYMEPIGKLNIIVGDHNVHTQPDINSKTLYSAYEGNTEPFNVYEIQDDSDYTWYRIGSYTWIADQNDEWLEYIQN